MTATQAPTPSPLSGFRVDLGLVATTIETMHRRIEDLTGSRQSQYDGAVALARDLYLSAPTAPVEASGSERERLISVMRDHIALGEIGSCSAEIVGHEEAADAILALRPQPSGETREAVLSETEAKVLLAMDGDWDDDFGFRHTCDIADNAEVASDLCKAVLTVLRLRGLVDLRKGLLTEEGRAFGSGWQITNEGHDAILALLSARPLALGGQS